MRKMTQHVAIVKPRHRHLRDHHLQEGRKRRKHTKLVSIESKTCGGGEVAALHDARGDEDLGVLLVDHFQASGAFQITYKRKQSVNINIKIKRKKMHCR